MIKRLFSMLCAAVIASAVIVPPAAAEENVSEPNTAEVIFNSANPSKNGFKTVEPGKNTTPLLSSRGGEICWLMDKLQGNAKSTINFTLDDKLKPKEFDGSIYDIEVEYFDSGKGYCFLFYNNTDGYISHENSIYTNATGTWKTQKFTVSDADFSESANGKYDFYLSIKTRSIKIPISGESIAIRRVKVTRRPNVNKLYVSTVIDEPGNSFKWFAEDKIIKTTVHNYSGADADAEIKFKAVTDDGFNKGEITENVSLLKGETKDIELNFGNIDYCDIYGLYAEVKMSDGTVTEQMPTKFAIIKTDPDGIKNDEVYFAAHLDRYTIDTVPEGVDVLAMSNVAGMRENINDNMIIKVVPNLLKNGLKYLPIYAGLPADAKIDPNAANSWSEMPYTEKGFEGWRRNVISWTTKLKDVVDRYEIWNEPEGGWTWRPAPDPAEYARFCIETARAISKADRTARIITGSHYQDSMEFFDAEFSLGTLDVSDAVSYHSYQYDERMSMQRVRALRGLLTYYGSDAEIIQGESGSQSKTGGSGALGWIRTDERMQAKQLLRHTVADILAGVAFTSVFSCVDMAENLDAKEGEPIATCGYFGLLGAEFDKKTGRLIGDYYENPSYFAFQNLCAVFDEKVATTDIPVIFTPRESIRIGGSDCATKELIYGGIKKANHAAAFVYWNSTDMITVKDYESTVSFELSGVCGEVRLIDPMDGCVYALPEDIMTRQQNTLVTFKNIPVKDYPLILTFGDFCRSE